MNEVKVAMLGFGGIAKSHKHAYEQLEAAGEPIRLVAICDVDETRFTSGTATNLGVEKAANLEGIHTYTDVDEMLRNEEIDMVDICIPSYLHKEYAVKMMKAGKDVLSEKPMALTSADCEEMLQTARACGRRLMIGQCLRFEPSYLYLKQCIDGGCFGRLKNLFMERLSVHPMWGFEKWYTKTEKSGGCILDLHVHDIDMARFLLGEPDAVSTVSYDDITRWQVVNTRLFYKDVTVIATASWDEAPTVKFSAGFRARFEQASVVLGHEGLTVYPNQGTPYHPDIPRANRMAEEIRKLASMVRDRNQINESNPPESACQTVRLIERLRESADQGGKRIDIHA